MILYISGSFGILKKLLFCVSKFFISHKHLSDNRHTISHCLHMQHYLFTSTFQWFIKQIHYNLVGSNSNQLLYRCIIYVRFDFRIFEYTPSAITEKLITLRVHEVLNMKQLISGLRVAKSLWINKFTVFLAVQVHKCSNFGNYYFLGVSFRRFKSKQSQ